MSSTKRAAQKRKASAINESKEASHVQKELKKLSETADLDRMKSNDLRKLERGLRDVADMIAAYALQKEEIAQLGIPSWIQERTGDTDITHGLAQASEAQGCAKHCVASLLSMQ